MNVMACLDTVFVNVSLINLDGNAIQVSVPHFGFGHQRIGKPGDVGSRTLEEYGLQTVFMIDPNVHGGDHDVVVRVLQLGDALRQVAGLVIIDIGQRSNAEGRFLIGNAGGREFATQHVAYGFGAVLVTALTQQAVKLVSEIIAQRNGEPFHMMLSADFNKD